MFCPRCRRPGPRRLIAPNYYECLITRETWASGTVQGQVVAIVERCDTRYHTGPAPERGAAVCHSCTTYAIRTCVDCGEALCGDCSGRRADDWLCSRCLVQRDERSRQEAERIGTQRRAARDAQIDSYRALTPVSKPMMKAYLDGKRQDICDGVTHQLWEWTNGDIDNILDTLVPRFNKRAPQHLGPGGSGWREITYAADTRHGEGSHELLKAGGYREVLEPGRGGTDEAGHPASPRSIYKANQQSRFNDRHGAKLEELPVDSGRLQRLQTGIRQHRVQERFSRRSRRNNAFTDAAKMLAKIALTVIVIFVLFKYGPVLLKHKF